MAGAPWVSVPCLSLFLFIMMNTIMSDVTPCNQLPGPVSEKFVTEDSTGVAAQASVSVNATGEKRKARLVQ